MKIQLDPPQQPARPLWQVHLDQHRVSFRSEAEARQFIATLESRLSAPHALPGSSLQRRSA